VEVEIVIQHDVEAYMYQLLNEMDMWSLVEKNPKETGMFEKHNTKVSLCK
jgi:hypothetical protein